MGRPLSRGALAALGVLWLAAAASAGEAHRIFLTGGYRYVPADEGVDEARAEVGLALCGTRCNALSADFQGYLMTMGWRLVRVPEVTERVVDLKNPFLDGRCVCTGEEYVAELYLNRPSPGPAGSQEGGAPR